MTRLPSRLIVDLMLRSAVAAGGFALVLARGDDHGGAIIVQCRDRDQLGPLLERDFNGRWQSVGPDGLNRDELASDVEDYIARRRRVDADLWVVELDIPEAPQFVAALTSGG
ncbi:MAG: DUF1491 family protein [Sphingopyxis sp.]|nr:DUF1491 family protein [Sphingopyxis sp.]